MPSHYNVGGSFGAFGGDDPAFNMEGSEFKLQEVPIEDVAVANAAAGRKPPGPGENFFTAAQAIEPPPALPQSTVRPPGAPGVARSSPSGAPGAAIARLSGLLNQGTPRGSPTAPGGIPSLGELIGKI